MSRVTPKQQASALPAELRINILKNLLVSPSALFFKHPLTSARNKNKDTPFLNDVELATQFKILCLVSQQTKTEAQQVFFENNEWTLEFSERWVPPKLRKGSIYVNKRSHLNAIEPILSKWSEGIQRFRNLRLDLAAPHNEAHNAVKQALETLVPWLNRHNLKRLVIHWNSEPRVWGFGMSPTAVKLERKHRGFDRNEDASRDKVVPRPLLWYFAELENTIEPLSRLCGVESVSVTGCVTDEWAR
jgi:hypothetical protein